jgi:hypothetical protein
MIFKNHEKAIFYQHVRHGKVDDKDVRYRLHGFSSSDCDKYLKDNYKCMTLVNKAIF